jgi:hypothetical protein
MITRSGIAPASSGWYVIDVLIELENSPSESQASPRKSTDSSSKTSDSLAGSSRTLGPLFVLVPAGKLMMSLLLIFCCF